MNMRLPLLCLLATAGLGFPLPPSGASRSKPEVYTIDPVHSSVVFRIGHLGVANFYGTFAGVSGTYTVDPAGPEGSRVEIEIDAASVETRDEKRDQHVRSSDFLDVKQFPVIRFESTKIRATGEDRYELVGTLELHGVSKEVKAALEKIGEGDDPWGGYRTGYEARFDIQRSEFGMSYGLGSALGDEVHLIVALEGERQQDGEG